MSNGNSGRSQQGARDARSRHEARQAQARAAGIADSARTRAEQGLGPIAEVDP